jgi:hypothetical protein
MFKKFLLICLLITFSATSAPQNQSYLQQSPWNGWGGLVDWSFRSLRVGFALEDSLLEDGWVLADSGQFGYLSFDSLALDSLDLQYIHSVWGSVDTLVADSVGGGSVHATGSMTANNFFAADSLTAEYCTLTGTISAVMGAIDSVLTVSDSLHVAGNTVIDGRLFADSSVMVEDTLYTPYLAGSSPINVLDSLLTTYIGSSTSISATNNVSANDLMASDSLIANTVNSTYTVRAGGDITGHASSVYLSRLVSRNGYVFTCYSPIAMALYGATFTLLGTPALAATISTRAPTSRPLPVGSSRARPSPAAS